MTNQNNAAQAAEQEIDAIMEQAQVFASAWSFLGGPFDNGSGLETAERERAALRTMLFKLRAEGVQAGDERAAFEAAMLKRYQNVERAPGPHGGYLDSRTGLAWRAWNDRAALAPQPAAAADAEAHA